MNKKLRIAYASDVHLEFGNIVLENTMNADVLVLAGDICVSKDLLAYDDAYIDIRSQRIHDFFINCSKQFTHIVYVAGNHEAYHGDIARTIPNLKKCLSYIKNLHILDKESVTLDGVVFVGATLWTDMNDNDPETIDTVRYGMNDFKIISNSKKMVSYKVPITNVDDGSVKMETHYRAGKWDTVDAIEEFNTTLNYFKETISDQKKYVVVTHHCPSFESVDEKYITDSVMNGGYCSNLEKFIEQHPSIAVWFHGHVHSVNEYAIGQTWVRSNPRGYIGYEARADEFELNFIDI